jgi:hypothetical protein
MHTSLRRAVGFGVIAAVATLALAQPAWSDDDRHRGRRDDHRERFKERREHFRQHEDERRTHEWGRRWEFRRAAERREWERRRDLERHRAAAFWRFERDRGWRWEHRPGAWSPFFVWWVIDGRPLLRPVPTVRIVRYPTGYYELVGNGITVPYYWVWRPTVVVAAPPPVPLPPAAPPDYPFPGGAYPPPPPIPTG